jgi:hypothetical protein
MIGASRFILTQHPGLVIVESDSHPGTYYTMTGFGTAFPVCSCPGASWKRGDCKHARQALAMLAYAGEGEGLPVEWAPDFERDFPSPPISKLARILAENAEDAR